MEIDDQDPEDSQLVFVSQDARGVTRSLGGKFVLLYS